MTVSDAFAYDAADSDEIRLQKFTVLLVASACCLAGCVWSAMYALVFGWGLTTALPAAFAVLVGGSLIVSHLTRDHRYAAYAQIICIIYITTFIQWSIGGMFDSGFVLAWAFLGPIGALIFFSVRQSIVWLLLYLANIVITVVFDDFFASRGSGVAEGVRQLFVIMNLSVSSLVIFVFAGYFVTAANRERRRANELLLNILPKEIAARLKSGRSTIADHYDSASVLFADIVGSTPLFSGLEPAAALDWLNEVFSMFDQLVLKYGAEKIRTIGDNYMVACGVPAPREDHAKAIALLALDMVEGLRALPPRHGKRIDFRLGINSGPMVAGVIGKLKFQYDVWGDTVNTASRMESHGEAGRVHISDATYQLIKDDFDCECRGVIEVKGKGNMTTWFLLGLKRVGGK